MWAPAGLALLARDAAVAREAARSGALAAALATAMALGVWVLLALPATIIGATVAVEALLLPCSLAVMYAVPPLFPAHSSRVFFVALSALSESESVRVRGLRVVRGLAAQLRTLVFGLLAGVGAIALLFSTAPFWLPAATAGFIAVAAVSPFLLPFLAAALFIAFWCTSWVLRRIAAFTILGKISMAAAVVITAGWVVGLISLQSVQMIGEGYMTGSLHGQQLLVHLAMRLNSGDWDRFARPRHLTLAALGLPVWALMRFVHPLLGLVYAASGASSAAAALVAGQMSDVLPAGQSGAKDV